MIDKDKVGQTLIPDNNILEDETSGFLACKATRYGDCLFHSTKSERRKAYKKGSRQNAFISKRILLMKVHQKNLLRRIFFSAKSVKTDQ